MDDSKAKPAIFRIGGYLAVQKLGFGAMRLVGPDVYGEPANPPNSLAVLRHKVELGINLIDTAEACGSACKKDPVSGVIGVQKGPLISMV